MRIRVLAPFRPLLRWYGGLVARLQAKRLLSLANRFENVFLIKYVPPGLVASLRGATNARLIYDFDDAVWLRAFLGEERFAEIVSGCDVVTCDNVFLAERAREHSSRVLVFPGPPQVELFNEFQGRKTPRGGDGSPVTIGWVGSQSTLFYLYGIYDALEALGKKYPFLSLTLLGTGHDMSRVPPFHYLKVNCVPSYDQKEMIRQVSGFDIGIFPVFGDDISLGRGCLKATIYMAAKVPAVCTETINSRELIQSGENGFLVSSSAEWFSALEKLALDREMRQRTGQKGFETVWPEYSIEALAARLETAFSI